MVSESLGETSLKAGAVLGALSTLPPIYLDDTAQPAPTLFASMLALSATLATLALILTFVGSKSIKAKMRTRYSALTVLFVAASCGLFFALIRH